MSDSKRVRGNIGARGKRRIVKKSKWELPFGDSKPYWDKICAGIESKTLTRVRNSSSNPFSYPIIFPSTIRYSAASSVSRDDKHINDSSKRHLETTIEHSTVPETILKVAQSSKPSRDSINSTELPQESVNFSPEFFEDSNDHSESSKSQWRLTKLSKITRLINDFLSSTRPRVTPTTIRTKKFSSPSKKSSAKNRNRKSVFTREKSVDDRAKDNSSECESSLNKKIPKESKEVAGTTEDAILKKRSVGFRDDLEKYLQKDSEQKDDVATATKTRRTRAPSLSVASALPSFGRVVISIEDIDSTENEEDYSKSKEDHWNSPEVVTSRDYRKTINPDEPQIDDPRSKQDFLKVPEIRLSGSAFYPSHDKSNFPQKNGPNETRQAEEAYASELRKESRMLRKKHDLWPKRSLVHVFRALKTMKNGLRSKARMELETNRFFAAPIDIYSPSARSSFSSEDRNVFMDDNGSESEANDEIIAGGNDGNGSMEKIDGKSDTSSYTSVRERLMRNALAHFPKDSLRYAPATRIDTDNALEAKSEREYPSSFYNSWATRANEFVAKPPNRKTLKRHFIGIPRMARIFPRIKGDKCLACMHKSLENIDQTRRRKTKGTFLDDGNQVVLDDDEPSAMLGYDFSTTGTFDHFYRDQPRFSCDKLLRDDDFSKSLIHDEDSPKCADEPESLIQESSIGSSKTADDSHRSRTIVKSGSKPLISAKSLINSLSLMSERSRTISDQDDSDQGCTDPVTNDIGLGGGSTSKNLAPCHMPINLKPSLEPLKALRSKKSRSIRSRVASAEKSVDSSDEDDEDSNYNVKIVKQPMNFANDKFEARENSIKLEIVGSPNDDNLGEILGEKDDDPSGEKPDASETQSIVASLAVSSKIDDLKNDFSHSPIISDREVIEISAKSLEENKTITEILRILIKEYSKRLSERLSTENHSQNLTNARKKEKIAINLMTLLVDSKSYANREKLSNDFADLSFSSQQPVLCNSRKLRRILPLKSYNLVAPILGMDKWYPSRKMSNLREIAKTASRMGHENTKETTFDLIVHPPSISGERVGSETSWKDSRPKLSPYSLFLMKPRRKAVTWRPLTERDTKGYDPEATLKVRAAKITDKICQDFCQWWESLAAGTNQTSGIDVDILKDMFEIDFTAEVCRTMQVAIREMPMVPIAVAIARNCPNAGELALTRRHLVEDAKAEMRPKKIIGFGTSLPDRYKFLPPRNRVEEKWLQCENVPKDLETMDAVWKDITHLNSVKGFINWLKAHPEVKRPKALEQVLNAKEAQTARQSIVNRFKHLELDLDQIQNLKVGDNAPDAH